MEVLHHVHGHGLVVRQVRVESDDDAVDGVAPVHVVGVGLRERERERERGIGVYCNMYMYVFMYVCIYIYICICIYKIVVVLLLLLLLTIITPTKQTIVMPARGAAARTAPRSSRRSG